MRDALYFLVDSLLTIYLYALVLRFVMQLTRADFRNPFAHFITTVTNPLILPLRRVLPPVGKVDSASVLAIVIWTALKLAVLSFIAGTRVLDPFAFSVMLVFDLVVTFIKFFTGAILIYALLSWVVPAGYNPVMALLGSVCEPVLRPFRRLIPPIANVDLSALWALLALGVLLRLVAELPQLFAYTST
ncbi:MAG TPA: YggT family protein [Steroidobacteraceae bacterium]|nr:YggT family protein [Steroidobacteraceae bacterium]